MKITALFLALILNALLVFGQVIQVEDFDSYFIGTSSFPDWYSDSTAASPWEVEVGPTASSGTGPYWGVGDQGGYIYMESSGDFIGSQAVLVSYPIDLVGNTNTRIDFDYHMFGPAIGSLKLEIRPQGEGVTTLWSLTGQQQTSSIDPWRSAYVNLEDYADKPFELYFRAEVGFGSFSFYSDVALDNIRLFSAADIDLGSTAISADPCENKFSVEVENLGVQTIAPIVLGFSINGGGIETASFADSLSYAETKYFEIAPTEVFEAGTNTISAWVIHPLDSISENDTTTELAFIATQGFTEDFDDYPENEVELEGFINTGLLKWRTQANSVFPASSGPTNDVTGGNYIFIQPDYVTPTFEQSGELQLCVDLSKSTNSKFTHALYMYGSDIARLEIFANDSLVSNLLGEQQGLPIDPWILDTVDLSDHDGERIKLMIKGTSLSPIGITEGDIALDAFAILGDSCNVLIAPENLAVQVSSTQITFHWDSELGSKACRINGGLVPNFSRYANNLGMPIDSKILPLSRFGPGVYNWRVQCSCSLETNALTSPWSVIDTFTVLALREAKTIDFELLPNPTNDFVELILPLKLSEKAIELKVLDVNGKLVHTETINSQTTSLNVGHLPMGAFRVVLSNPEKTWIKAKTLVIN